MYLGLHIMTGSDWGGAEFYFDSFVWVGVRSQVTASSTWQWHVETEHGQTRGSTSDLRSPPIVLRSMKSYVRIWYRWCALSDGWWLEIARYYNILICVLLMLSTIDLCLIVCTMVDGHIMAPPDSETVYQTQRLWMTFWQYVMLYRLRYEACSTCVSRRRRRICIRYVFVDRR